MENNSHFYYKYGVKTMLHFKDMILVTSINSYLWSQGAFHSIILLKPRSHIRLPVNIKGLMTEVMTCPHRCSLQSRFIWFLIAPILGLILLLLCCSHGHNSPNLGSDTCFCQNMAEWFTPSLGQSRSWSFMILNNDCTLCSKLCSQYKGYAYPYCWQRWHYWFWDHISCWEK